MEQAAAERVEAARDALVIAHISDPDPGPLEVVESYVAEVLTQAGFVVRRVNIEWLT